MSEDVEKLKQENEKLKKELNYLRQIKEALDKTTIISKTDPEGIITDANEMFEKISGYDKEELIGKPHNIVRHPAMPKSVFKKMWETIKKGKIFRGVIRNRKKDGSDYYVLANIIPIKNEKGEITEYIAIRHDITKRMQYQKEKDQFSNLLIEYILKQLKTPINSLTTASKDIFSFLNENDFEKIENKNLFILKNAYILEKNYKVLKTILEFKQKTLKPVIEPIQITKILQYLFRKYYKLYDKKIHYKIYNKNIIINTDKILFALMLEILYVKTLLSTEKEITVSLFKENSKPVIVFEYSGEEIIAAKVSDFFHQLLKKEKDSLDIFLVQKISNLFEYEIKTKKEKKNKIYLYLNTLPPKKLLN
jgi:PAS domain S-box-containing protein